MHTYQIWEQCLQRWRRGTKQPITDKIQRVRSRDGRWTWRWHSEHHPDRPEAQRINTTGWNQSKGALTLYLSHTNSTNNNWIPGHCFSNISLAGVNSWSTTCKSRDKQHLKQKEALQGTCFFNGKKKNCFRPPFLDVMLCYSFPRYYKSFLPN